MKTWMDHSLHSKGNYIGQRWMWVLGAGSVAATLGGAGLIVSLCKKPASKPGEAIDREAETPYEGALPLRLASC